MPYKNDPRRTVTINLLPDEYDALAADALQAGYATPGTYAKALVRARGQAPKPIRDERMADRVAKWKGRNDELTHQLQRQQAREQALHVQLRAAQAELAARPSRAEVEQHITEAIRRQLTAAQDLPTAPHAAAPGGQDAVRRTRPPRAGRTTSPE